MKLYGSTTSPYVRRLRILLSEFEYEFVDVNVFGEDREKIKAVNPTLKVPMLEVPIGDVIGSEPDKLKEATSNEANNAGHFVIVDSTLIFEYLTSVLPITPLTWPEKNELALINSANDALVNMMILKRSNIDISQDKLYFNIQRERCEQTFDFFEGKIPSANQQWNYVAISLLAMVEWASFRELFDFSNYPNLQTFITNAQSNPGVKETSPK